MVGEKLPLSHRGDPQAAAGRFAHRTFAKARLTWARITKLADDLLPQPRILHPWPNQRFAVNHPR